MKTDIRVVFNRLLGAWYIVRGPHQTPLNGAFATKAEAIAWLNRDVTQPKKGERIGRALKAGDI